MATKAETPSSEDMVGHISDTKVEWPKLSVSGRRYERPISTYKLSPTTFVCVDVPWTDEVKATVDRLSSVSVLAPIVGKKATSEVKE